MSGSTSYCKYSDKVTKTDELIGVLTIRPLSDANVNNKNSRP